MHKSDRSGEDAMIAFLSRMIDTTLGRVLSAIGVVGLFMYLSYSFGYRACKQEFQRKSAEAEAAWSERVAQSEAAAYKRGLEEAKAEAKRLSEVEKITRDAGMESGAEDLCITEDVLDRIRALQ